MRISHLSIANFKGVHERQDLPLKKITVVIGGNSSGKSSILHALTCLGQTAKLHTDTRSIVLDDERADIHLGRFIEVIHSKRYTDRIGLGISTTGVQYGVPPSVDREQSRDKIASKKTNGTMHSYFEFACTKRTQDISLHSADLQTDHFSYSLKKHGTGSLLHFPGATKGRIIGRINKLPSDPNTLLSSIRPSTDEFLDVFPLLDLNSELLEALSSIKYLGPFRQAPMRTYPTHGAVPSEVGSMGEATISMLANEVIQSRNRVHLDKIAGWLNHLGIGKRLKVTRVSGSHLFDASLELPDGSTFPLADLGYGTSQVLPVLTQCSFSEGNETLLFEQPELHLHSACARKLAKVFIETVEDAERTIVIETHSPDLVREFFQEIQNGTLSADHFALYKAERQSGRTILHEVDVQHDEYGVDVLENWEKGIT